MKTSLLTIALFIVSLAGMAQDAPKYKVVGNEIVKIEEAKAEPTRTNLTHTIKGFTYPVYSNSKGNYFIIRVSKKTGKEYKQTLKTN